MRMFLHKTLHIKCAISRSERMNIIAVHYNHTYVRHIHLYFDSAMFAELLVLVFSFCLSAWYAGYGGSSVLLRVTLDASTL